MSKTNLGNVKPKLFNIYEGGVTCLDPECNKKFATVKERNHHMCIANTVPNNNAIENESKPFASPSAPRNMSYHRKVWLTRHIAQCH